MYIIRLFVVVLMLFSPMFANEEVDEYVDEEKTDFAKITEWSGNGPRKHQVDMLTSMYINDGMFFGFELGYAEYNFVKVENYADTNRLNAQIFLPKFLLGFRVDFNDFIGMNIYGSVSGGMPITDTRLLNPNGGSLFPTKPLSNPKVVFLEAGLNLDFFMEYRYGVDGSAFGLSLGLLNFEYIKTFYINDKISNALLDKEFALNNIAWKPRLSLYEVFNRYHKLEYLVVTMPPIILGGKYRTQMSYLGNTKIPIPEFGISYTYLFSTF